MFYGEIVKLLRCSIYWNPRYIANNPFHFPELLSLGYYYGALQTLEMSHLREGYEIVFVYHYFVETWLLKCFCFLRSCTTLEITVSTICYSITSFQKRAKRVFRGGKLIRLRAEAFISHQALPRAPSPDVLAAARPRRIHVALIVCVVGRIHRRWRGRWRARSAAAPC